MVQQSTNNIFENVYKFNGKELDEQTGYYYYGARYYDPGASIFLSVDPLAEKMPQWNPYSYTFNNPINFTDPTGMVPEETAGKDDIIINNKEGNEIARILMDTGKYDYAFNTDLDYSTDSPHILDFDKIKKESKEKFDAVGLNLEASATVGGGMEFGISLAYFLDGEDKGKLGIYTFEGGNVGFGGGVGAEFFTSNFNNEASPEFFNAKEFGGAYNSYSGSALFYSGSMSWSNEANKHDEVHRGERHTTTWTSFSAGSGWSPKLMGKFGGKFSGGNSTFRSLISSKKVGK